MLKIDTISHNFIEFHRISQNFLFKQFVAYYQKTLRKFHFILKCTQREFKINGSTELLNEYVDESNVANKLNKNFVIKSFGLPLRSCPKNRRAHLLCDFVLVQGSQMQANSLRYKSSLRKKKKIGNRICVCVFEYNWYIENR